MTRQNKTKIQIFRWVFSFALGLPLFAEAQFEWDGVKRIVAVGDIHGDQKALKEILLAEKIVNRKGDWIGRTTHLVMMGDLVAGKAGTKEVIELLMSLEVQAEKAGGKVHSLMGNHDILVASGEFDALSKKERLALIDEDKKTKDIDKKLEHLFSADGPYAKFSEHPLMIRINDHLFLHAGLDERMSGMTINEVNTLAKKWILFLQDRGPRPPKSTEWLVGLYRGEFQHGEGPAFTRDFKVTRKVLENGNERPDGALKRKQVRHLLEEFKAADMIIGHVPTPESEILLKHPYYKNLVVSLDTRISDKKHGRMSALEIKNNIMTRHYFERSDSKVSLHPLCGHVFLK